MKLIRLSNPVIFNQYVQPIALPARCRTESSMCLISGFGNMSTPTDYSDLAGLKVLKAPVMASSSCRNAFDRPDIITQSMICFGDINSCKIGYYAKLRKGGPAECNDRLQGIFSWNYYPESGTFTKICMFNDWIEETMASY